MPNSVVIVSINDLEFDVILVMLLAREIIPRIVICSIKELSSERKGSGCQFAENVTERGLAK